MTQTREQLIEVMARATCISGRFDPDEFMPNGAMRWQYYVLGVTAALAALEAAGVRLAPVQPTHEMQFAGGTCQGGTEHEGEGEADTIVFPAVIYRAMLAASPYAPKEPT